MATVTTRTCSRCHLKKIKCTGFPNCRNCSSANVHCERYARPKKSDTLQALTEARRRIQWLEGELHLHFDIDCRQLPTGTSLPSHHASSPTSRPSEPVASASLQGAWPGEQATFATESPLQGDADGSPATNNAPDISLLAFNATGEMKYLGPSSGAFFATYATAVVRSFHSTQDPRRRPFSLTPNTATNNGGTASPAEEHRSLSSTDVQTLLRSYQMWVHPLHPLFDMESLEALVARCHGFRPGSHDELGEGSARYSEMAIFYLVMALGAANYENTVRQEPFLDSPRSKPSPSYLYSRAMRYFDGNPQSLQTSISTIQIVLLISIYSSFGPVGSSQWQLAGVAMRMAIEIGLHHAPKTWQTSAQELDRRNRVFWTAYAIEISLAYNLGRPPSIGEEYITSSLPDLTKDTCLAIQQIKHRQIQSRIVSQVYCGTNMAAKMSMNDRQEVISKLQAELDEWKSSLASVVAQLDVESPYPFSYWERLYHGTSFVLHRSSPLCPHPSAQSLEQCIRSAGEYISCMVQVLRNSNVPLSWMLIQGVLFAGLTMLITARTGVSTLTSFSGLNFLLVELPSWTRKCSICLAIMNERWSEDLLSKLDTQFEALANDTLKMISSTVTNPGAADSSHQSHIDMSLNPLIQTQSVVPTLVQNNNAIPTALGMELQDGAIEDWDQLQFFREFIGIDGAQTFWDIFPTNSNVTGSGPASLTHEAIQSGYPMEPREDLAPSWQ